MKLPFLLLLAAAPAFSQLVSIGVKAGVPLTDAYSDVQTGNVSSSHYENRYTVGPTAEIHLPFHFSFEVDALYRHSGYRTYGPSAVVSSPVNEWQIPLLGKYELPLGPILPFIDAGITYRHLWVSPAAESPDNAGFTIGGGIGLKILHLRLAPEIRYTYWGQTAISNLAVHSGHNQADFLVGFTF